MPDAPEKVILLGDSPVLETGREDWLKYTATASVLASATVNTADPLTIGVFGEWGTGKTSLMRLIKQEAERDKHVAAVWFNAWQYEKEEHLIVPLIATINKELDRAWPTAVAKGAKSVGNALRAIIYGFSVKGKVGIPHISEAEVNLLPKDMIARYQELTKDSVLARSLYFDAFEELRKCGQGTAAPRIVVFVDDLDRCFPNRAVELLEGIKLVLHQPGFSFVLGLNETIIEGFIKAKYKKDYEIEGTLFDDYLDKMVQVRIPVPKRATGHMQEYIGHLLDEAGVFSKDVKRDAIPLIADACKHNPRKIVRLLNRIIVTSRISALEGTPHDPVSLLIHAATDEPRYAALRSALDVNVIIVGKPDRNVTIGAHLAEELHQFEGTHLEWVAHMRGGQLKSMEAVLERAVGIFEKNEHLWRLMQSGIGQEWLKDSVFRATLNRASETSLGEGRAEQSDLTMEAPDLADPIRELLDNMVRIPAGTFKMGSKERANEQPVHEVTLGAFEIAATPVTQAQYEAVMGGNPSFFEEDSDNPVECVTWDDAITFCTKLKERTGQEFTLPSEAQWEYACRAGSVTRYCFGDNDKELDEYAWYGGNSGGRMHPVGRKKPNAWGLYDMHGNVWEWCRDSWYDSYIGAPTDGSAWEDPAGSRRVLRGGSWDLTPRRCRSASRSYVVPDSRNYYLGFRVVRTL